MDRKTREELNDLSKRVWGSSSRWKKLVEKGFIEFFERDREVMVPGPTGVKKKVFTDRKGVLRYYTVEEIRKVMTDLLEAQKPAIEAKTDTPTPTFDLFDKGVVIQGNGIAEGTAVE